MFDLLAYIPPGYGWSAAGDPLLEFIGASLRSWVVLSPLGLLLIAAGRVLLTLGHRVADLDPVCSSPRGPSR